MLKMRKPAKPEQLESRLSYLISQLRDNLGDNEDLNRTYNRLLLERAMVRKNIKKSESKNILTCFCEKLNKKRREKLICDYFKNK